MIEPTAQRRPTRTSRPRPSAASSIRRWTRSARPTASRTSRSPPAPTPSSRPTSTWPRPSAASTWRSRSSPRRWTPSSTRGWPARWPGSAGWRSSTSRASRPATTTRTTSSSGSRRPPTATSRPSSPRSTSSRSARTSSPAGSTRSTPRARRPRSPRRPARPAGSGRSAPSTARTSSSSRARSRRARHLATEYDPLSLAEFTRYMPIPVAVGNTTNAEAAFALMEQGAAAVFVGVGPGRRLHDPRGPRHRRPAGHGDQRRGRGARCVLRRDRPLRPGRRRRRDAPRRRAGQGDRRRRRRADDRLAAGPRRGGARPRHELGDGRAVADAAARDAHQGRDGRHRSSGSCSARPTSPTGRRTSSARCASRWRRSAPGRSATCSGSRWSTRRRPRPRASPGSGAADARRRLAAGAMEDELVASGVRPDRDARRSQRRGPRGDRRVRRRPRLAARCRPRRGRIDPTPPGREPARRSGLPRPDRRPRVRRDRRAARRRPTTPGRSASLILRYGTPAEGLGHGPSFRLRPVGERASR